MGQTRVEVKTTTWCFKCERTDCEDPSHFFRWVVASQEMHDSWWVFEYGNREEQ